MYQEFLKLPFNNMNLIYQLTKREVVGRYKGSALGLLWSFIVPLVMLGVYTFVFGMVFKARWGVDGGHNFSVLLFAGLTFHAFLAECLTSSPGVILNKPNFVKKVVFPLEILPIVSVLTALFHFCVSLLILFFAVLWANGSVPLTWLALPFVFLPLFLLGLAASWLLASLGVYLRDIGQMTGVLATLLMFLCPIFYPLSAIPEAYQPYILLNPLSYIVEEARNILVFGTWPEFKNLAVYTLFAFILSFLSFVWFSKTRRGFADVL
ncbi:ABC transporter permease [Vibrio aestuarianus]|uniref:Transport permease protein n=1 Tax=Vibrio aestuarianus TaxID=28171 RepID=A0AAX3U1G5_9VIBR|nr:ABC transporter permease [Vibrio aestuarianus]WGK81288.1 ABC transporter permease [Vibrio aestuarianus]